MFSKHHDTNDAAARARNLQVQPSVAISSCVVRLPPRFGRRKRGSKLRWRPISTAKGCNPNDLVRSDPFSCRELHGGQVVLGLGQNGPHPARVTALVETSAADARALRADGKAVAGEDVSAATAATAMLLVVR